jgi:hypothetical protein
MSAEAQVFAEAGRFAAKILLRFFEDLERVSTHLDPVFETQTQGLRIAESTDCLISCERSE